MLGVTLWLLGVFVCASCAVTCPDGTTCSNLNTCCMTKRGYSCCHYPNVSLSPAFHELLQADHIIQCARPTFSSLPIGRVLL